MDAGGDFTLLADEKFDFDISLSPTSAKEDREDCDDEVFIGPVRHKEKCISAAIQSQESDTSPPLLTDKDIWSPLSGDKFVEIFKEAHLLALQLECFSNDAQKEVRPTQTDTPQVIEKFVQEPKSIIKILENCTNDQTPVALKRETYCIQDSPFNQLPPSVQQRLAVPSSDGGKLSSLDSPKHSSPGRVTNPAKGISVSPLAQKTKAVQLKRTVPVGNANKTAASRLQPLRAPTGPAKNNRLTTEKPKGCRKVSPAKQKHHSSAGSSEDVFSDKSSIASDISDSSFNSSIVGQSKRTIPAPSKVGLRKMQFKAPANSGLFRKNTSSSSSSHSSINSSLNSSSSFSPPGNAKLNASLNTSISGSRLKPNPSRLALVRPVGGSNSSLKINGPDPSKSLLKQSSTAKAHSTVNGNKSSSVSVAHPQTPVDKMHRQASAPNLHKLSMPSKPESAMKGTSCTKPQARIMPTPTSRLKLPPRSGGVSPERSVGKTMQPTRLLSCEIGSGIAESTPLKPTQGAPANTSFARSISTTPSTKHVSALPTPLSRRTSGMLITPRTIPRSISSIRPIQALQSTSKSTRKPLSDGYLSMGKMVFLKKLLSELVEKTEKPKGIGALVTTSPSSSNEEDNTPSAVIPCSLKFSPENKVSLLESAMQQPLECPQTTEVLLIDIEVQSSKTDTKLREHSYSEKESQPLIDLSNTPELNMKVLPLKPALAGQLIDLSSPLIKLSPVVNKENVDSPLLKF
ncbi:G2 and S phase-expressed protein 1 [Rhinophrynus dorsalis]